jgi:Leucine-rich repeat (LRR) protein
MEKVLQSDPLTIIGKFLDTKELCVFSQVSKSFYRYTKIIRLKITSLDIQGFGDFVKDYKKLIALVVSSLSSLDIDANEISELKNLRYLSLTNIVVKGYLRNELSSLILFNTIINGSLELSSITNLCIKDKTGRFQFGGLPSSLKVLRYVDESRNLGKYLDPTAFCLIHSLEKLQLSCSLDVFSVEALHFFDRIRSLEFSFAGLADDINIRFPPNLEELNLMGNSYMDVVKLFRELAKLKYIKTMDLSDNEISDVGFRIENFPSSLEILIISKNRMSNIGMLIPIFRKFSTTKIKELTLDYISSFSQPMFEDLLSVLPHLESISVCGFADRACELSVNIADEWIIKQA